MVSFQNSETKLNLMRAFAGESQARNRYTFAAEQAAKQNLHIVQAVFTFTANQEKEHGEIFYQLLQQLNGETIKIDGSYPVNASNQMIDLLHAAYHNEMEEYGDVYPKFAEAAKQEGFQEAANAFDMIAKIEKVHADRFENFAKMLREQTLFVSDVETGWICLNCGHVHYGKEAPKLCPVCKHNQGFFIRLELAPYTK